MAAKYLVFFDITSNMYRQDDFGCAKLEQEINGPAVLTAGLLRCIITLLLFSEECGFSMFLLTNRFLDGTLSLRCATSRYLMSLRYET